MAQSRNEKYRRFGTYVRSQRLAAGFTSGEEFLKKRSKSAGLDISLRYLHTIESGDRVPKLDVAMSLCKALGSDPTEYFRRYLETEIAESEVALIFDGNKPAPSELEVINALANQFSIETKGELTRETMRLPDKNLAPSIEAQQYLAGENNVPWQIIDLLANYGTCSRDEIQEFLGPSTDEALRRLLKHGLIRSDGRSSFLLQKENLLFDSNSELGKEIAARATTWKLERFYENKSWQLRNRSLNLPVLRFANNRVRVSHLPILFMQIKKLINSYWSGATEDPSEPVVFLGVSLLAQPEVRKSAPTRANTEARP